MSERTPSIWTCDRCGRVESLARNDQPLAWRRLTKACPPKSAEPAQVGDLCQTCFFDFDSWFRRSGRYIDPAKERP